MTKSELKVGGIISGFMVERMVDIPELRSNARILTHEKSGARYLHLLNDDPNNLFCIGLRTPVGDNTGVPHILEHSVLCGSQKFPVKDPFQVLLKGSLQTFLNAMTYPDKTVYPVSSQVERDFYNLVDVYCDAVFRPLLTRNTFYQEGWHFDVENPEGPVGIKGIVYNEMKGVFSDFRSHVNRRTFGSLFPDTTYAYESGGEPAHITDLTYEQFKEFHATFYHPANSYIFTYGNLPTEKTLEFIDRNYLSSYKRIAVTSEVKPQTLWTAPRTQTITAPSSEEDDGKSSVILCWIFCNSADPVLTLAGSVLARYLLATEGSPVRRALIDSKLGEDLDDMCGFDADVIQGVFAIGLRKTTADKAAEINKMVLDVLKRQVEQGMDHEVLEGAIRRIEFSLREISDAGRYPFNLKLMERSYRAWIYGADPLAHLAFEAPLTAVKNAYAQDKEYFGKIIQERLLNNPHLLTSVITASHAMGKSLEQLTQEQAQKLSAGFTAADIKTHYDTTKSLLEEQKKPVTPEALACIPRLSRRDMPARNQEVPVNIERRGNTSFFLHPVFSAGVVYFDIGFDCNILPPNLVPYLPLYADLAVRCGAGAYDYEQMSKRISLGTGGISAGMMIEEPCGPSALPLFRLFFHGKALASRVDDMMGIFTDLFLEPRLNDTKLISDILLEMRNDFQASVVSDGHTFASSYAASRLHRTRRIADIIDGVEQLRFLGRTARRNDLADIAEQMQMVHRAIINSQTAVVSMTADDPQKHIGACAALIGRLPGDDLPTVMESVPMGDHPKNVAMEISSSVNYVCKAWRLAPQSASGLGLMSLLGTNLSRGALWDSVRVEGGAYGSWASLGSTFPVFSCASYRDPNLSRTLGCYETALKNAATKLDDASVDQSVVATIGQIDKPRTPHRRGFGETVALLLGKTPEFRQEMRNAVLEATAAQVRVKAQEIVDSSATAVVVLGSKTAFEKAASEGVTLVREPLMGEGEIVEDSE